MLQDWKDKLAQTRNRMNCAKGKHREAVAVEKTEAGSFERRFCQSCGADLEAVQPDIPS